MPYRIEFRPAAAREFRKLPQDAKERVGKQIDRLARNPRPSGAKKLEGEESIYRVRVGDYRILYQVLDAMLLILVVRVGHRRESLAEMAP